MSKISNNEIMEKLNQIELSISGIKETLENKVTKVKVSKKSKESVNKVEKIEKSGNVTIKVYMNIGLILGDTFNKKNIIKKDSGYWSPEYKGWIVKSSNIDTLEKKLNAVSISVEKISINEELKIVDKNTSKTININKGVELETYGFIDDD